VIEIARTIDLPLMPDAAWAALWDVPRVARCLPGCQEVTEVEPRRRYRASVKDRVGPFTVTIPLDVTVEPSDAERRLGVHATGRDAILGSPVRMSLTARLTHGEGGGSRLTLGQAVIHRRTRDILDAFARQLSELLGSRS
jgi:carbon monoxide dehydrogenase subunit G